METNKEDFRIEKVASGRWLILDATGRRRGEVFGGSCSYQAQTMRGRMVGNETSLRAAARLLQS
jgi:hypothetical protein